MLTIGLTGNIGSGKTTIAMIFKVLGIEVYHADDEAKKFLFHTEVVAKLVNRFGTAILTNQLIDRSKLAKLVFPDPSSLQFLNHIIHPLLKTDFENWVSLVSPDCKYVVQEAAILFESGFNQYVDKTILVTAPKNIRMQRVCKRDHIATDLFLERTAHQWSEVHLLELTDFKIVNDDTQLIIPQVLKLHQEFSNK